MATTLTRFADVSSRKTYSQQCDSDTNKATDSPCSVENRRVVKSEASPNVQSCPFSANQNGETSSLNADEQIKASSQDEDPNSTSLLGTSMTLDQGNTEGTTGMVSEVTCVYCNKMILNKSALDEHVLTKHQGKKLYDCSVCEKRFTHRSSRDIHLRVHTGQRPYECDFCKKRFRVSSHLRDHVRTHTGERPFKCSVCGRGFKQSSDMKKHRKTHFKSLPPESSYMIVIPEDSTTVTDHIPKDFRSLTGQRQNLKLVIKRERKQTDVKSPNEMNTVSGNDTLPDHSSSEYNTQSSTIDSSSKWASSERDSPICKTGSIEATNSSTKAVVKRQASGKNHEPKNGCKTIYPSLVSDFTQIDTNSSKGASQQESVLLTTSQPMAQSYASSNDEAGEGRRTENGFLHENQLKNLQESTEKRLSYDERTRGSVEQQKTLVDNRASYDDKSTEKNRPSRDNQPSVHMESQDDDVFWQPEQKVIKREKLSPNAHEQSAYCQVLPTISHVSSSFDHVLPTIDHVQTTVNHEPTTAAHNLPTYHDEEPAGAHRLETHIRERPTKSEQDSEHSNLYEDDDAAMATDEKPTNDVTSDLEPTSANTVAMQQADSSARSETQPTATGTSEDDIDDISDDQVAQGNATSESEVNARKQILVKLRRSKSGGKKNVANFSVQKPSTAQLNDQEESAQCSVCQKSFANLETCAAHNCGKNGKEFECNVCSKTFARGTLLRQHMVLHQGSKRFRFKCNYCGRAFRHRSHLRDHERIHTGERPFKCSFCPKAFKQSSDHRKHENLHTGTTRYRCEKCSLDFKRCDALKRHAMMHTKGEITLLKCEKCRSLFATADGHMSHVCWNKPYRYRCQICPERFTEADELRRHCYEHHGEQSTLSCLKCEFCKLEFNTLEELDKHLGTHRLEKTHTCRTCDQRFSLLNQLVEHVKIHSTHPSLQKEDDPPVTTPSPFQKSIEDANSFSTQRRRDESVENQSNSAPRAGVPQNSRQTFDFIPSRYQSLIHSSSIYGELAAGNWARPRNFYFPIRQNDLDVARRPNESIPISSRINPKAFRSASEPSRQSPTPFRGKAEVYRRHTEPSVEDRTSSENDRNVARSFTTGATTGFQISQNDITDETNGPALSAHHGIALPKSTIHNELKRKNRNEPTDSRTLANDSMIGRYDSSTVRHAPPTTRRDILIINRHESPEVDTRNSRIYFPEEASPSIRSNSNPDSLEMYRDPDEIRKYSKKIRLNSDDIRSNFEDTRTYPESIRRSTDEDQVILERKSSKSENNEIDRNAITHRENTVISEEHRNDKSPTTGSNSEGQVNFSQQSFANRKYSCLNCRREFYQESSLVEHVCEILCETLYCCLVCDKDFGIYEDLQVHMRSHWKPVVYFKCTLCGRGLKSEESLKEHNLKHLENARAQSNASEEHGRDEISSSDKEEHHRISNGSVHSDHSETYITPPDSAKSVTSPVICSVSGNIVTTGIKSEKGYTERHSSMKAPFTVPENNNKFRDDAPTSSSPYIPYYEARKQAHGYLNAFSQDIAVSGMHAAIETSGRYPIPNGLIFPTMTMPGYTVEN